MKKKEEEEGEEGELEKKKKSFLQVKQHKILFVVQCPKKKKRSFIPILKMKKFKLCVAQDDHKPGLSRIVLVYTSCTK